MVTDEELSRFIDGELADSEAEAVSAAIAADAGLAARLDRLRSVDRFFADAVSAIGRSPLPQSIRGLIEEEVVPARAAGMRRKSAPFVSRWRAPIAIAASFALGVVGAVGLMRTIDGRGTPLAAGPIAAGSRLAAALDSVASGERHRIGAAAVTPILSYRTTDGLFCRELRWDSGADSAHGVACRKSGAWTLHVVAAEPAANGYRPASSSPAVDAFVDGTIASDPLSGAEERAFLLRPR